MKFKCPGTVSEACPDNEYIMRVPGKRSPERCPTCRALQHLSVNRVAYKGSMRRVQPYQLHTTDGDLHNIGPPSSHGPKAASAAIDILKNLVT